MQLFRKLKVMLYVLIKDSEQSRDKTVYVMCNIYEISSHSYGGWQMLKCAAWHGKVETRESQQCLLSPSTKAFKPWEPILWFPLVTWRFWDPQSTTVLVCIWTQKKSSALIWSQLGERTFFCLERDLPLCSLCALSWLTEVLLH